MQNPIGLFDSGVGGTSTWKEINKLLPAESTLYLADCKNNPYGGKSKEEIIQLSVKNTEFLLAKGCKIIVVACNAATTNAIAHLRAHYNIPFVGIEPAIKPAALQTQTQTVGVLATKGTLASSLFHSTSKKFASGITVLEHEGTGLVELVEAGKENSAEARSLLKKYIDPMLEQGIDHLVLGCTHYPYLIPALQDILPKTVTIIDAGGAVARQTKAVLAKNGLLADSSQTVKHLFHSNARTDVLQRFVEGSGVEVSYADF